MSSRALPHPQRTLGLIVGLLLLPFVVALGLYLSGWRPAQTANHGQLIEPPTALAVAGDWPGKWTLLLVHDAPCGAPCLARLDELRRLRVTLGRDMGRSRVAWLGAGIDAEAAAVHAAMPDIAAVDGQLTTIPDLPPGSLLLVDPQGRAMLRYRPDSPADDLRRDVQRLLKNSG